MSHPKLPTVSHPLKWSLLLSLALLLMLTAINQLLITLHAPQGIISFQLAASVKQSLLILDSWGDTGIRWAMIALWLDFVFIAVYLAALLLLTDHLLSNRRGVREQKVGRAVKALFLAAGVSDAGENILLLSNLSAPTEGVSIAATTCAMLKFTGLIIGTAGLIVIHSTRRRPRQH
ncbi:hypothetical protein [Marinobacter caseinilyticus]|uniref:hypothetical protein n=1 Tax=Marinobacter caseinilyticus TaxID=2692195 RepID=UPI00140B84A8|nr:hypothetical protein [Marinobacter caseinilyticus]